jgi:hypothetical protein
MYKRGVAKWDSNNTYKGSGSYYLIIQDDGNAVICGTTSFIWALNIQRQGICQDLCIVMVNQMYYSTYLVTLHFHISIYGEYF